MTARDLGNNFLVSAESLGHSRAQCVAELLQEMNETVVGEHRIVIRANRHHGPSLVDLLCPSGTFVEESPGALLDTKPVFFKDFTLVIATQMREAEVIKLDALCRHSGIPLLITRSYGLVCFPTLPSFLGAFYV